MRPLPGMFANEVQHAIEGRIVKGKDIRRTVVGGSQSYDINLE
ncbi:MAG: hypothetical protein ACYC3I_07965 [Gemmataceae bacterium]